MKHLQISSKSAPISVRARLITITALLLVPAYLCGAWGVWRITNYARASLMEQGQNLVHYTVTDVERELDADRVMLTALASSSPLQNDNFEAFHREAAEVSKQLGVQIFLSNVETGKQILNASVLWGEPLPPDTPKQAVDARVKTLARGIPIVSNVYYNPILKKFLISIGIPIYRHGKPAYFLAIGVPTAVFVETVTTAAFPSPWIVSLIDRDNRVIARSERQDEVVGTKIKTDLQTRAGQHGIGLSIDRFGTKYHWIWQRSAHSGLLIVASLPATLVDGPRYKLLAAYIIAGGLILAAALGGSSYLGGRLSRSIGEMGIDREPTQEEFRTMFENAPNGVLVVDNIHDKIAMANDLIQRYFGYSHNELVGQPAATLLPDRLRGDLPILLNGGRSSPPVHLKKQGHIAVGRHKDGSEFPIEIFVKRVTARGAIFTIVTIIDISERLHAQERLKAATAERDKLRRSFLEVQEQQRLSLSRELHDETGQNLAAMMIEMKALDKELGPSGRVRLKALRAQLEQMSQSLYRVAKELRPASIDELGLSNALANYVSEWSDKFGIASDFHCDYDGLDRLPERIRTAIYRIVQEGLTNISKHASNANVASVVINQAADGLRLAIENDSAGVEGPRENHFGDSVGGLGLAGMRERLALLGGEIMIESSHTRTTLFARIPIQQSGFAHV